MKFARADETLKRLRQSRFDNSRDAEMLALTTVDLLILDDFALEPMSKEESKDRLSALPRAHRGRGSMIVTSNRDTAEWLAMFDDVLLAQSAPSIAFATPPTTSSSKASRIARASSRRSTPRIRHPTRRR